jgi:hypothetical protein
LQKAPFKQAARYNTPISAFDIPDRKYGVLNLQIETTPVFLTIASLTGIASVQVMPPGRAQKIQLFEEIMSTTA